MVATRLLCEGHLHALKPAVGGLGYKQLVEGGALGRVEREAARARLVFAGGGLAYGDEVERAEILRKI